ncbi:MAG: hypothetical protein AB7T27_03330 [Kiritimatiellia bacterium]
MNRKDSQMTALEWEYHCQRQEAIAKAAKLAKFKEFSWTSESEVLAAIREKNAELDRRLQAYLAAFHEWYKFAVDCKQRKKPTPLKGEDYKKMGDLILKRDLAREEWEEMT